MAELIARIIRSYGSLMRCGRGIQRDASHLMIVRKPILALLHMKNVAEFITHFIFRTFFLIVFRPETNRGIHLWDGVLEEIAASAAFHLQVEGLVGVVVVVFEEIVVAEYCICLPVL